MTIQLRQTAPGSPRSLPIGTALHRFRPQVAAPGEDDPLAAPEWTLPAGQVASIVLAGLAALFASALL